MRASTFAYTFIVAAWTAHACITLVLFLRLRRRPCIRFRQPLLTTLATLPALLISDTHLVRFALGNRMPCYLLLWIPSMCFPIMVFAYLMRYLRLGQMYRASLRRLRNSVVHELRQGSVVAARAYTEQRRAAQASGSSLLAIPPSSLHGPAHAFPDEIANFKEAAHTEIALDPHSARLLHHRLLERTAATIHAFLLPQQRLLLSIFAFLVAQTTILSFIQHISKSYAPSVTTCKFGWEFAPFYTLVLINIIPGIPIFLLCRGVSDIWGIKLELDATALIALSGYSLSLVFDLLKSRGVAIATIIPAPNFLLVSLMAMHHVNVVVPLIEATWPATSAYLAKTFNQSPTTYGADLDDPTSWPAFKRLLSTPAGLHEFRTHAAREFSVENVLFWERVQVARAVSQHPGVSEVDIEPFLWGLWETFCQRGAELELNLRAETSDELRRIFSPGRKLSQVAIQSRQKLLDLAMASETPASTQPTTPASPTTLVNITYTQRMPSMLPMEDKSMAWTLPPAIVKVVGAPTVAVPSPAAVSMAAACVELHGLQPCQIALPNGAPSLTFADTHFPFLTQANPPRPSPMCSSGYDTPIPSPPVIGIEVFARAEVEALRLMYESTYPRFIAMRQVEQRRRSEHTSLGIWWSRSYLGRLFSELCGSNSDLSTTPTPPPSIRSLASSSSSQEDRNGPLIDASRSAKMRPDTHELVRIDSGSSQCQSSDVCL